MLMGRTDGLICNRYEEGSEQTLVHLPFGRPALEHLGKRLVDFCCFLGA
jgi:hypothetical protein